MSDRAGFKGKIKIRLPLKVRRLIHEISIAARLVSSRAKRRQHNSPRSYKHPNIYPEIDTDIEPIIDTRTEERRNGGLNILTHAVKKLGFVFHRDNLDERDGVIAGTVKPHHQGDRLADRSNQGDNPAATSGEQANRSPADRHDFPTDWPRPAARGKSRAQGPFALAKTSQKSGEGRVDTDTQTVASILSLDGFAALLLGALLFISPLYSFVFSQEPLPAYMLAAVAFAVHACNKIRKGKLDLFGSRLNTALFILPLLALFSSIGSWDTRGAVGLFLLLSSCFAAYWLTSSLAASPAAARGLLLVMIAGGAAASILMLTPIAQGSIANELLYSVGAILSASYLCCTCFMSYYETVGNQTHLITSSTAGLDSDYQTPLSAGSTISPGSNDQTPFTAASATSRSDYLTSINPIITLSNYQTPINPTKIHQQKHSKLPHKTIKTLINPTLFAAGYFILMSVTALGSVLTYAAILLGIALLLYGLAPAMRKNTLGIILIQGASVFLVIRPVQESLAAGSSLSGWLWAGTDLLISIALLNTWHRLKKYAKPYTDEGPYTVKEHYPGKEPQISEELDTSKKPYTSNDFHLSIELNPSQTTPAAGYRKALQRKPHRRGTRRLRPWVIPTAAVFLFLVILISGFQNIPLLCKQTAGQQPYPLAELMLRSRDGLKAMATSPRTLLLGAGGGGWQALSHMHQSFYYEAPVPGAFLQAGVELGIFGLLAFCAAWSIFINKMKQLLKASRLKAHSIKDSSVWLSSEKKAVITATAVGVLALGCHLILWCGFSPAASLYLFVLFGLGNCLSSRLLPQTNDKRAKTVHISSILRRSKLMQWSGFLRWTTLFSMSKHNPKPKLIPWLKHIRRPKFIPRLAFFRKPVLIHRPGLRSSRLRLPKLRLPRLRLPKVIITGTCLPKITISKAFSKISIGSRLHKISLSKHRFRLILIGLSVSSDNKGSINLNDIKNSMNGERVSSGLKGSARCTSLRLFLSIPLAWAKSAAANSQRLARNTAKYLTVLAVAVLIFNLSWGIWLGEKSARTAAYALEKGDIPAALHNMEKAARLDPFNSSYHKQLGMLYLERGSVNGLPKNGVSSGTSKSNKALSAESNKASNENMNRTSNRASNKTITKSSNGTPTSETLSKASSGDAGRSLSGVFPEALNGESKRGSDEQENLKKAVFHFQRGLRLSRGDVELRVLYAEALLQMGKVEEGAAQLKEAIKLRPLQQNLYEYLSLGCLTAGRFLLEQAQIPEKALQETADQNQQKNLTITLDKTQPENLEKDPQETITITLDKNHKESLNEPTAKTQTKTPANTALLNKARSYLKAALRVPEELEKRRARINKNHLIYWRGSPYLGITPKIQLYSGEAAALLGDWPQAVRYLNKAARDASLRPEALLWKGLVQKRTGLGQMGETLISRALQEKPELADELNKLEELFE